MGDASVSYWHLTPRSGRHVLRSRWTPTARSSPANYLSFIVAAWSTSLFLSTSPPLVFNANKSTTTFTYYESRQATKVITGLAFISRMDSLNLHGLRNIGQWSL